MAIFGCQNYEIPEPIDIKFDVGDHVGDFYTEFSETTVDDNDGMHVAYFLHSITVIIRKSYFH